MQIEIFRGIFIPIESKDAGVQSLYPERQGSSCPDPVYGQCF
jgi:hypothetical protein